MSFAFCKENALGIGKVVDRNDFSETIEYFDSPASADRQLVTVPVGAAVSTRLLPQTRVYYQDETTGFWHVGRVDGHVDGKAFISLPNQETAVRPDAEVYTRWDHPIEHPGYHLAAQVSETPYFHRARVDLVRALVQQRAAAAGMTALLSAPIELEPHQIDVIRRVLQDPVQRYLLADEVGLGKTIEAGIIVRQHLLDRPRQHNVLILVPSGLLDQWRTELACRCHVDPTRYGHRVEFVSLEAFVNWRGEQPDLIVVDEAHQAVHGWQQPGGNPARDRFEKLRWLSAPERCAKLLLLSATPVRHNEDGFLALLNLLDPLVHPIHDLAGFRARVAKRQDLADLTAGFVEDQTPFFLESIAGQLAELFPKDNRLGAWLAVVHQQVSVEAVPDGRVLGEAIRAVRVHLSETYRLHRRILRNRRNEKLASLLPGRAHLRTAEWNDQGIVHAERLLEDWRTQASAAVWDHPDSDWRRALASVFQILLEAAWGDCEALALCVEARLSGKLPVEAEIFGLIITFERRASLNARIARGLKQIEVLDGLAFAESLPARERGLKLLTSRRPTRFLGSLPARERGLKLRSGIQMSIGKSRSPRGSVD
jgi:ATP-dependent helicase HepA